MAMTYYALGNLVLNGVSYTEGKAIAAADLSDAGRVRSLTRKGLISVAAPSSQQLLLGSAISNMDRHTGLANTPMLTTQIMLSTALPLPAGKLVTNLTFISASTPAGTPTNWWFALYSPAGALLGQTADQTTTAWAANTVKTLALAVPYAVPTTDVYYAAIMVKATTVPSLVGNTMFNAVVSGAVVAGMKIVAQNSGSALVATAPATIATPTTIAAFPLVIAS